MTNQTASFDALSLAASLTVKDLQASLAWYRDILGFAVEQRHEREGRLRAVSLSAGAVRVLINQDDGARGMDRVKGEGFSLMISTSQDVDVIAKGIVERGGTLGSEPTSMPWGARVFRLQDPDGYRIVISTERTTS